MKCKKCENKITQEMVEDNKGICMQCKYEVELMANGHEQEEAKLAFDTK